VNRLKYEPAAIAAFTQALLNLIALPFHLDSTLVGAANAVIVAGAGLFVRSQVASVAALNALAADS
jgi:hypothetical protein